MPKMDHAGARGEDETGGDDVVRVLRALHPSVTTEQLTDGTVQGKAVFDPQPEHRGNPGWLHGGMAATVLDHVCARTAAAALGHRVVTAKLDLRYRQPVPLNAGPYHLEALAQMPRRNTVKVTAALFGPAGQTVSPAAPKLVEATALFVVRPGGLHPSSTDPA